MIGEIVNVPVKMFTLWPATIQELLSSVIREEELDKVLEFHVEKDVNKAERCHIQPPGCVASGCEHLDAVKWLVV